MLSSPRMDGGSNFARTEFSTKPDAAHVASLTSLSIGGSSFAHPNLGTVGNFGLYYASLNYTANIV